MPENLYELFEKDREAYEFFKSLPLFIRDQFMGDMADIRSKEELSGLVNEKMREALLLDQYRPMFEDETDSDIDWL